MNTWLNTWFILTSFSTLPYFTPLLTPFKQTRPNITDPSTPSSLKLILVLLFPYACPSSSFPPLSLSSSTCINTQDDWDDDKADDDFSRQLRQELQKQQS